MKTENYLEGTTRLDNLRKGNPIYIGLINSGKVLEELMFQTIARGEIQPFLTLDTRCSEHAAPCKKCMGRRASLSDRQIHGVIGNQICNNIFFCNLGPNLQ